MSTLSGFLPVSLSAAKLLISAHFKTVPALFLPIAKLRENDSRIAIRRDSDILISGYWRCANHYAVYAFSVSQPRKMRVARHFHAPAQVKLAIRWNVPAVVLVREPLEAIASATIFLEHSDPLPFLRFYNIYHRSLVDDRDRIVISDFDRTTSDFASVIAELNERYGRDFNLYEKTPENEERVKQLIRQQHGEGGAGRATRLPLPSDEKDYLKERIKTKLQSPEYALLLEEARQYYRYFAAASRH